MEADWTEQAEKKNDLISNANQPTFDSSPSLLLVNVASFCKYFQVALYFGHFGHTYIVGFLEAQYVSLYTQCFFYCFSTVIFMWHQPIKLSY